MFSLQNTGAVVVSFTLNKSSDPVEYLPIKPGRYHRDGKGYTDKFVEKTLVQLGVKEIDGNIQESIRNKLDKTYT